MRARIETVLREMDETVLPTDNLGMLVVARGGRRHKQPKVHRDAAQGDRRLDMAHRKSLEVLLYFRASVRVLHPLRSICCKSWPR